MSYLCLPRLAFAGRFQGDVSTINNIPANYDLGNPDVTELWNPEGTGTFRLLDCGVTAAEGIDGAIDPNDPVLTAVIAAADERSSAKLVDLDPDWQLSSEIWSLQIRLVTAEQRDELLSGEFVVAPFRDLVRRQLLQPAPNGQPRTASFVSTIERVSWGPRAERSEFLKQLRAATESDALSIVLNTFGFYYAHLDGRFATGTLIGCLGPHEPGEPKRFVAGRRLQTLEVNAGNQVVDLIGPAVAAVDTTNGRISVDLGNSLPIDDADGTLTDLSAVGPLQGLRNLDLILLENTDHQSYARLADADYTRIGTIPYLDQGWYPRTAGVVSFAAADDLIQRAGSTPLALAAEMADGSVMLLNRETSDGVYYRADDVVVRLDPGGNAHVHFSAHRFGAALADLTLHVALAADMGGGTPAGAIEFPSTIVTGSDGRAVLEIEGSDPGNPRGAIDGQIYTLTYGRNLDGSGHPSYDGSGLSPFFDRVVIHLRDGYAVPDRPSWLEHIQPILAQFGRLYPIMSRHLVDLADYDSVVHRRRALLLAFTRPLTDSNYMPVTRDLSANKLATLVKWLGAETGDPDEPLVKGTTPSPAAVAAARPGPREIATTASGKPAFEQVDALRQARRASSQLPTI